MPRPQNMALACEIQSALDKYADHPMQQALTLVRALAHTIVVGDLPVQTVLDELSLYIGIEANAACDCEDCRRQRN